MFLSAKGLSLHDQDLPVKCIDVHTIKESKRYSFFLFFLLLSFPVGINAQLQADFNMDKTGGCSPLAIRFTNTSTGVSTATTYHWNFDNGNSSILKDAGAIFQEERIYRITLTVKNGTETAVQTKNITVYKKPQLDFVITPASGCLPLQSTLTASATPGDGTISSYHWDFGDGSTAQTTNSSVNHSYTFLQTATVGLTVVNNYGCSNSLFKPNSITVYPAVQTAFNADKTIACTAPAAIQFTNNSSGPGNLQYLWDFGDGNTSTVAAPQHIYTVKGIYTVKLTTTSDVGCSSTFTRNAYINVANFTTSFQEPALICDNTSVSFANTSLPTPDKSEWLFDNVNAYTTFGNNPISYAFGGTGNFNVRLTTTFGPCQQTIDKVVTVKSKPVLNGFVMNVPSLCGSPVEVAFSDTTQDAVNWSWNFDWPFNNPGTVSDQQSPHYLYTRDGAYQVALTVKNAAGCSASVIKSIGISKPLVGIFLAPTYTDRACGQLTTRFVTRTTEPISIFQWEFGDGNVSTDPQPQHQYTQPGTYTVTLNYTTASGCRGSVTYQSIIVHEKPKADFTVQSTVCGNTPVTFTPVVTGYFTSLLWNFGDAAGFAPAFPTIHQYQQEGEYDVTLIAANGMCNDTIIKKAIIKVSPPFPRIVQVEHTCEGTRGLVKFTEASQQVQQWQWDFGDGGSLSYTTPSAVIEHQYAASGMYKVLLTTTYGACVVKDSVSVPVFLQTTPVLTANQLSICNNSNVGVQVTGLQRPPLPVNSPQYITPYHYIGFYQPNGTAFPGSVTGWDNRNIPWQATLSGIPYGQTTTRVVLQSTLFGCRDTSNFIVITVKGPTAGLRVVTDNVCFKSPVVLQDESIAGNNRALVKCAWDFGDASGMESVPGASVSHRYSNPGNYTVRLTVTDIDGCSSSTTQLVRVTGPKAAFVASGVNVPLNSTVVFTNTTNNVNSPATDWQWNFGDGNQSTAYSSSNTYTSPGVYTVSLIAHYPASSCTDTAKQTITVNNFTSGFVTNTSFIGQQGVCPPVLARFANTSTNYYRLEWDFGDNVSVVNQSTPSHVYEKPGVYIVKLTVFGFNNQVKVYTDTIRVTQPRITIAADDLNGCKGHTVQLHTPVHEGANHYTWDFGNGVTQNSADSFSIHSYLQPGNYQASVLVKDQYGCAALAEMADMVVIYPDPVVTINPAVPVACKGVAAQLTATGAVSYQWSPVNGLSSPVMANTTALPTRSTIYTVHGTDINGCSGAAQANVIVPSPISISNRSAKGLCKGDSLQLNITGAFEYEWINTTTGLSNTFIGNPLAYPLTPTQYTVVGHDAYHCYSDTQQVMTQVYPLPTVHAGADIQVMYGSPNRLTPVYSNDVVRWNWTPATFLDCATCSTPESRPYREMDYVINAYTANNCKAADTLKVSLICGAAQIHIPNAFTPDRDGKNDVFTVIGHGVKNIRYLRIFNRWGEMIFERRNFYPNDQSSAWDGRYKNTDAPAGTYVYVVEMECGENLFQRKGSVTLVR